MRILTLCLLLILPLGAVAADFATEMTVASDGSGDFTRLQDAIDASKSFPLLPITIHVKNGVYQEKVDVHAWNTQLSLIGESREGTIIRFGDHFERVDRGRNSTFMTYTLRVAGNDFHAQNLTIENTAGPVGQAVALHVEADRAAFVNVSIKGYQDTVYLAGEGFRSWFSDCYIEGTIDFIFGQGTALFENCELRSLADGYVTAASTPAQEAHGLVFSECRLTAAPGVDAVYLGRPWRPFANAVFMDSEIGSHILPAGWHNWDDEVNEETARFAEYRNRGPGAERSRRVPWARQLKEPEAAAYRAERLFRGWQPPGR
ncbi:pectin esterase [Parahaliea maris]|uniref:Pectinesterase n=1 Tax=Parahaliea maris TaxID=2716870 RepID=A0A5C8ZS18_9GAMM|nr:pectinesterase family protein [Parahaliea maris]TXS91236.1 pectin esterase [Parahaliea maris]